MNFEGILSEEKGVLPKVIEGGRPRSSRWSDGGPCFPLKDGHWRRKVRHATSNGYNCRAYHRLCCPIYRKRGTMTRFFHLMLALPLLFASSHVYAQVLAVAQAPTLAVGGAPGDASALLNAAIAATVVRGGGDVVVPCGTWRLGATPVMIMTNIHLRGLGRCTNVVGSGANSIFVFASGASGAELSDLSFDGRGMTAGDFATVDGATRIGIRRILATNPYNFLSARSVNQMWIADCWVGGIRGKYAIRWWGDDTHRSDVLDLVGSSFSGASGSKATGIDWDGNANTLAIHSARFTSMGRGMWIRNTGAGKAAPSFLFAHDLEVDYPQFEALRIEAGSDYRITNLYAHGSKGENGIYVGPGLTRALRISQGKITGHYKAGINTASNVILEGSDVAGNSLEGKSVYSGVEVESGGSFTDSGSVIGSSGQAYGINNKAGAAGVRITAATDLDHNALGRFLDSAGNILTGQSGSLTLAGSPSSTVAWNSMPAAPTMFLGSTRMVQLAALGGFSQVRLIANMQSVAGPVGAKLALLYAKSPTFSISNFYSPGISAVEIPITTANTVVASGWVDLKPAARGDVYLAVAGYNGDGKVSPTFGEMRVEFR
jgi:hypothetical protein